MDTPAWARPQAPAPAPSSGPAPRRRHRKLLIAALITGAIASVVSAYFIWNDHRNPSSLSPDQAVLLVPHSLPLFQAALFEPGTMKVSLLSVQGQGTASVIGYAHGENKNYYLLSTDGKTSNVFVSDAKHPKAGLAQHTMSSTLKLGISYDAQSDLLAYATLAGSTSMVTLLRPGTTTEERLTVGANPVVLKGGFFIAYEKEGKLYSVSTSDKKSYPLLSIPEGGAYAVDAESLRAVVYNPEINALQYFSLKNMDSASAESSVSLGAGRTTMLLGLSRSGTSAFVTSPEGLFVPMKSKHGDYAAVPDSAAYVQALVVPYNP